KCEKETKKAQAAKVSDDQFYDATK
ncbi:MAG: ApbE family protein, partial [Marinomonas sp.]